MGVRVQIGEFPFEASDYAVEEWATPLAAGDSSGSVGRLSFTLPQPNLDLIGTPETAYTEWVPQATNLATNSSFEVGTGTIEVFRNIHANPRLATASTGWYVSSSAARTAVTIPGHPYIGFGWIATTTSAANNRSVAATFSGLTVGQTYTAAMLVQTTGASWRFGVWDGILATPVPHTNVSRVYTPSPDWHWEEITFVAVQTSATVGFNAAAAMTGVTYGMTAAVVIKGDRFPGFFFDGAYSGDSDMTPAWAGTANASQSILSGVALTGWGMSNTVAIRSSQWAKYGTYSLRIIRNGESPGAAHAYANRSVTGLSADQPLATGTGTIRLAGPTGGTGSNARRFYGIRTGALTSYAPNSPDAAGEYDGKFLSLGGTATSVNFVIHMGAGVKTGHSMWFDAHGLFPGDYTGGWFDGHTASPDDISQYRFTGADDTTPSVFETRSSYVQGYTYRDTGWKLIRDFGPDALLDLPVRLTDSYKGFTVGTVTGVQRMDDAGTLQVTCSSRLASLNAYGVQAQPFIGTLEDAFKYYLSLADIVTDLFVDEDISTRFVIFPGWTGELWYHLKEMAAAQDCDIALVSGIILLRPIRERIATRGSDISRSRDMPTPTLAQSVEVYLYNNREIVDELVYPPGGWTPEVEVLNVNAGETVQYTLDLSASVSSIVPPTMETWVEEENSWDSVYTIVANDGLPVKPSLWASNGGSLAVTINPDTTSLTVTLTGAKDIPTTSGTAATNFSVALASDTTGNRYSTLRILGTGVGFHKEKKRVRTGVPAVRTGTEVGVTIDNPFISTVNDLYRTGTRAAKQFAGLAPALSGSVKAINRRGDSGNADYPTYGEVEEALYTELGAPTYGEVQSYYVSTLNLPTYGDIQDYWFELVKSSVANQVFGNVNGARIYDLRSRRWYRIRQGSINPDRITFEADDDLTNGDVEEFHLGRNYGDVQALFQGRTYKQVHLAGMYGG